jgi:molybdenum cofactor synthesis domain-containing protein
VPEVAGEPGPALRVHVVTVSTRAAAHAYEDRSGPAVVEALHAAGVGDVTLAVVPDDEDELVRVLRAAVDAGVDAVLTTGGTGLAPDDRTPEATCRVLDRAVPGIADAIRATGQSAGVATAVLSRGVAGVAKSTLVVNLPGSVGGARDAVAVVAPLLAHVRDQLAGGDH